MRKSILLLVAALHACAVAPAAAVNIAIDGQSDPLRSVSASGASEFTVTIGFEPSTLLLGYDLSVAWDPVEVSLSAAANLANPGSIAFTSPVGGPSTGSRVADTAFAFLPSASLFSLTFTMVNPVQDGLPDIHVFLGPLNGSGISPATLSIENPLGAAIDIGAVPEPGTATLVGFGLLAGSALRRRA